MIITLSAFVLVCSLAATPNLQDCNRETAIGVLKVPETFLSPSTCFLHASAYIAETPMGQRLGPDEAIKIECLRTDKVRTS